MKLGDVCRVDWGNTDITKKSYVDNGQFIAVSAAGCDGRLEHYEHKVGTAVISAIGARCGTMFFPESDFTAIKNTITLTPKENVAVGKFLYYLLSSTKLPKRGSAQPFIAKSDVQNFFVELPPLPEQRRISTLLGSIQKAIDLERRCEASLTTIKRAALHVVFTKGLHNEAQRETPLGLVPESWGFSSLGSIAEINYGAQASVADATNPDLGTLILTNVNLGLDGYINLEKRRYYEIPEIHKDRLSLKKGDVLFNWRSGSKEHIGKSVFFDLDESCTYSSFILRFRVQHSVASKFLYYWLTYLRVSGFFITQRNVSSINSVYNASLSATIPIYFPDKTRQQEIVDFLTTLDQKLEIHRRKRACLENIFRLFLPNLTRGTWRLTEFPEGYF